METFYIDTKEAVLNWAIISRRARRNDRRAFLRYALNSKDKKVIWTYCYQKATLKEMSEKLRDVMIYGQARSELDAKKIAWVLILTERWAARLNRICGI